MTPILPGRFQPFHTGHLLVVQGMMKMYGEAHIVICEPRQKTAEDLFTADERREMIGGALMEAELMDASLAVLHDDLSDEAWLRHLLDVCGNPAEPIIFTGRPEIVQICEAQNVPVKLIKHVPGHEGEEIRTSIKDRTPLWTKKVPAGVGEVIESVLARV
jgi:nicotinamide-nucleotide adenylyltransferase